MLPTPVRKIIEAYSEDMSILEELQKLKYNDFVIQRADAMFFGHTLQALRPVQDPTLTFPERLMCALSDNVQKAVADFPKTTAGWVYKKIDNMESRRIQIWCDIAIVSKNKKKTKPFLEMFKDKFAVWRRLKVLQPFNLAISEKRQLLEESKKIHEDSKKLDAENDRLRAENDRLRAELDRLTTDAMNEWSNMF